MMKITLRSLLSCMGSKTKIAIVSTLGSVIVSQLLVLGVYNYASGGNFDIGVETVKTMYQFDTPTELLEKQAYLRSLLVPDEFDRLCIDNDSRAISAYYKFKYRPSKVNVIEHEDGYVLYTLLNDNISKEHLWVFEYCLTDEYFIDDVKEYRVIDYYDSEVIW